MYSSKTIEILSYLKEHDGEDLTAAMIAEATGYPKKTVDGVVTSGLQRKGLSIRVPAQEQVTDEEGNTKYVDIKIIKLTDAGRNCDPEAENAAEEEAKAAEKAAKAAAREAAKAAKEQA